MFPVNSAEAVELFLSEFGCGEDSCLCDVSINASTWVDEDGSMNFGSLTMSASMTLQRQSQENSEAKILLEGIKSFRINGLDKNGYDGIIQDLRLRLGSSSAFFLLMTHLTKMLSSISMWRLRECIGSPVGWADAGSPTVTEFDALSFYQPLKASPKPQPSAGVFASAAAVDVPGQEARVKRCASCLRIRLSSTALATCFSSGEKCDLPHARGGVSRISAFGQLAQLSSPRPWGCFSKASRRIPADRSIMAAQLA